MGSYTFTWEHFANEVLVTGTFDNWQQTVRLQKLDGTFKKEVELPKEHIQYKFVVDGTWCINESAPKTSDGQGGHNNVLTPDDIKEPIHTLSSAAPASSTAALAGAVPREENSRFFDSIPGAFPLTPPAETPSSEPMSFSINPIPATEGAGNPIKLAPGEPVPHPSTFTSNTIHSTVKHDKEPEEEKVSVAPIPATAGIGNPIHLAPGEQVPDPSTLTSNTINSTARTDAASYEKSDGLAPQLDPVVLTPEVEREAQGGMFSLPPLTGSLIPESSLPKDASAKPEQDPGVTIQSAAPTSTTAALAGNVPLEPRGVPETVTASQKEAGFNPEAAANPEAVEEKQEVEQELKAKVPEEPAAADNSTVSQITTAAAAGATATASAFAAATYAAKDKAAETIGLNSQATSSHVPGVVAESQKEAHASPEASANPEAVEEKSAVEQELKAKVPEEPATGSLSSGQIGASAAAGVTGAAAAFAAATYAAKDKAAETIGLNNQGTAVNDVPEVVTESQKEAHVNPEASANAEAVEEKKEVEAELLKEVKKTNEAGEPAPTITAATSQVAPGLSNDAFTDSKPLKSSSEPDGLDVVTGAGASPTHAELTKAAPAQPAPSQTVDSRDVSPMSKQPTTTAEQTEPVVTTGVESHAVEAKTTPETPKNTTGGSTADTPGSVASEATDKKNKRRSFFGKLKDKLKK